MSESPDEPQPYPWLPLELAAAWCKVDEDHPLIEQVRRAAADHCEDQRRDLLRTDPDTAAVTFTATDRVVQAGLLATARLLARQSSPTGQVSYGEFGAADILRLDPDVSRLLGVGRYARPIIGGGR